MDGIDKDILNIIRENGKTTNSDIAKKLEMAPSAILERIRKLEKKNIITGYTAKIDPKKIGQALLVFITVKVDSANWSQECGDALANNPHIEEVHEVLGENSYLIKARVANMDALSELLKNHIAKIPEVKSTNTTAVTRSIKTETIHPIEL